VPSSPPGTALTLSTDFDTGPLAGRLHAATAVRVQDAAK
jgi:hypothetical protein